MPPKIHIHSYIRISPNIYQCADPDCNHFNNKKYLKGKRSLCPQCKEVDFLLTPEHLRMARPVCFNCSNTKEAKAFREKKRILEELGI